MKSIILESPKEGNGWILLANAENKTEKEKITIFNQFCSDIFSEYESKKQTVKEEYRDICSGWEFPSETVFWNKEEFFQKCILVAKEMKCHLFEFNEDNEQDYTQLYSEEKKTSK